MLSLSPKHIYLFLIHKKQKGLFGYITVSLFSIPGAFHINLLKPSSTSFNSFLYIFCQFCFILSYIFLFSKFGLKVFSQTTISFAAVFRRLQGSGDSNSQITITRPYLFLFIPKMVCSYFD